MVTAGTAVVLERMTAAQLTQSVTQLLRQDDVPGAIIVVSVLARRFPREAAIVQQLLGDQLEARA